MCRRRDRRGTLWSPLAHAARVGFTGVQSGVPTQKGPEFDLMLFSLS